MLDGLFLLLEQCRIKSLNVIYDVLEIEKIFRACIGDQLEQITVTGSISNRIIFLRINSERLLVCLNKSLALYAQYEIFNDIEIISSFGDKIHHIKIPNSLWHKIERPQIKLVALYHPENFPLPRFPLGISDIAEKIRNRLVGTVSLSDMQLGENIESIVKTIENYRYDIVGISVTFGQQDIVEEILHQLYSVKAYSPLIVVGGSLAALNYKSLLKRYPNLIVSLGEGELTMSDIIRYWHGEISITEISDIAYQDNTGNVICTEKKGQELINEPVPALDLLENILKLKGVMHLETSRGCPNACSFCPRFHKGKWVGYKPIFLEEVIPFVSKIFTKNPIIARKIFLVDEECIGHKDQSCSKRVKDIADILFKNDFRFEMNARIDQVYRTDESNDWHIERIKFWKYLVDKGLERVLFGIESGVDSILKRFNKNTTKAQNIYAIRILSSSNIPVRYTYVTFDPLMTIDELIETYRFQGRRDLLLKPLPHLTEQELYELIHNDEAVSCFSTDAPFYRKMPYLLVSLECLLNSSYLKIAEEKGLAGNTVFSLGKREVSYICPEIGVLSYYSQLWIDRNFSLDYTLKSLIKISPPKDRRLLDDLRTIIKDYAYNLLGKMLFIITKNQTLISALLLSNENREFQKIIADWDETALKNDNNKTILTNLLEHQMALLSKELIGSFNNLNPEISHEQNVILEQALNVWRSKKNWELINKY